MQFLLQRDSIAEADGLTLPREARAAADGVVRLARLEVPAYAQAYGERKDGGADGCHEADGSYEQAPFLTKDDYFRAYPLAQRCWGGVLRGISFCHCSSGSSGTPTLWPRTIASEFAVACTFERVFHDALRAHERTTLCVVAFPLGAWVGGMFTTVCLNYLTMKGYRITIVTPGNKVDDILFLVRSLGPSFEQTIILGYPPFVKGVIDAGCAQHMPWPQLDVGLVLAGEVFSEEWRELVAARAGIRESRTRIVSLYGTADAGVIAAESPLSATFRSWLAAHPAEAHELFKANRLPTLCQYDPRNRLLDKLPEDDTLVVTCLVPPALLPRATPHEPPDGAAVAASIRDAGPPLLKYAIGDAGGIASFDDMCSYLAQRGMDVDAAMAGIAHVRKLPFVWVFGRSFWCVSVYGANVYVENIMVGLEGEDVAQHVTGKFVLFAEEDAELNKRLAIRVEVAPGTEITESLAALISQHVTHHLCRLNSEYAGYVPKSEQAVRVHLHEFGNEEYFPVGVKHKYTL